MLKGKHLIGGAWVGTERDFLKHTRVGPAVGAALVRHSLIRAVGFTGSLAGGRTLFDLCAVRPDTIPVFGGLGSVNPVFVLDAALAQRGSDIARTSKAALDEVAAQTMLSEGIAAAFQQWSDSVGAEPGVSKRKSGGAEARAA